MTVGGSSEKAIVVVLASSALGSWRHIDTPICHGGLVHTGGINAQAPKEKVDCREDLRRDAFSGGFSKRGHVISSSPLKRLGKGLSLVIHHDEVTVQALKKNGLIIITPASLPRVKASTWA